MWNKSISLPVRKVSPAVDADGITTGETYEFIGGIPANFRDATRDDEIAANQNGYTADVTVEIMACNYNGCTFFVDDETRDIYDIKRRFAKDKSLTVILTCQKRERGKDATWQK